MRSLDKLLFTAVDIAALLALASLILILTTHANEIRNLIAQLQIALP